jgi:hypothetical protein
MLLAVLAWPAHFVTTHFLQCIGLPSGLFGTKEQAIDDITVNRKLPNRQQYYSIRL